MASSSGTQQRWDIPPQCSYCGLIKTVEVIEVHENQARVKCSACKRAWRIEPTPLWVAHAADSRRLKVLMEAAQMCVNANGAETELGILQETLNRVYSGDAFDGR